MESARPWKRVTPVTGSSPGRIWQWLEPSGGRIQWSWGWGARRRGRCRAPRCTPSNQSGQGSLCGTPFFLSHWYHLIIAILVDCWRWLRRYFMITLVKIMLPNIKILLVVLKREAWQGWKLGQRVKCKGARSSCSWTLICCNLLTLIWYLWSRSAWYSRAVSRWRQECMMINAGRLLPQGVLSKERGSTSYSLKVAPGNLR